MAKTRADYYNAGADLGRTIVTQKVLGETLDPAKSWQAKAFNEGLRAGFDIAAHAREKQPLPGDTKSLIDGVTLQQDMVSAGMEPAAAEEFAVVTQYAREEYMPHATVEHITQLEARLPKAHGKLYVRLTEKISKLEHKYATRFLQQAA